MKSPFHFLVRLENSRPAACRRHGSGFLDASHDHTHDMALSMRSDNYFALYTSWEDERDDDRCQSWLRQVMKKVKSHSVGSYLGDSDLQKPNAPFWGNENARRLMRVCQEWDPNGRMCRYQIDSADLETRN